MCLHSSTAFSPVRCRVDGLLCRLNLLIAIMGDSYEKVKESERVEAIRERARIIVEMEKRFPKSHRYHRFMHYVEVADAVGRPQEMAWEGVTKRVTEMMRVETSQLQSQLQSQLESELVELKGEMNTKFELLDSKLDAILDSLKK